MSDIKIMIEKYEEYINENYKNEEGEIDFNKDQDVELFIDVLEEVKNRAGVDGDNVYKIIFEELLKATDDPEELVFIIKNFIEFLEINNVILIEDNGDFKTAIIDICNGDENLMLTAVEKFNNSEKNYDELYIDLAISVKTQKEKKRLPVPETVATNFSYIKSDDPINEAVGDYEPPYTGRISKKKSITQKRSVSLKSPLLQNKKNMTKKIPPRLSTILESSEDRNYSKFINNRAKTQKNRDRLVELKRRSGRPGELSKYSQASAAPIPIETVFGSLHSHSLQNSLSDSTFPRRSSSSF